MRKIIPILALIIFVVAISLAQLANSAWPVRGHDIQHTGRSPYVGPSTSALKWEFKTMMPVYSSPAIGSDGTIYVGSSGIGDKNVYAINPDGTQKWKFTTGDGVYCSPTLGVDGTIYVGSYDHNLYALNSDGSLKWTFTTGDSVYSCPAIGSDGTIYFGSEDQDKKVYALNPDGTLKWSFTTGFTVSSSPAISPNGTIYIGSCDNNVYALNPDGTQKWVFITRDAVTSSPAISTDGTIYVGSRDNNVYAINTDGTQKWSFTTGGPVASSPSIGTDGTIYIGSNDKNVYAINPDGTKKWFFITGGIVSSIPAIGADGIIYVGSEDKKTYALNTNGTQKWTFTTGGPVYSSPAIGADGILYIGSDDFKLYAIGKGITTNHTLTLTSPNGGEQFQVGSANPVTWTSTGNPGNVKIELFKGGILNNTISTNTSDTGSFNWNILATQATGTDYQVKISAVSDATITSQSAADFAITAGTNNNATISITSPNGSEQLTQGTTNPITWTSTGTPGNIKIELFKGGILNSTIAPNVANTGSYNWNIPATQTIGTDYQVKISAVTNNTINSQSAGDFEIIAGTPTATIFITSPLGSEQWLQNSTHPVTWSSTGNPGNVKIELLKNGVINSVIAAGIPDSGTYNWAIPQNQATGTDYQVRISAVANLQVTNQSAANFSILPGGNTPTLAAPALYLPANNSINVPIPTKFNWNAVLNAVSYNMQLADDAQFVVNMQENNITSINASTTGLTPGAAYYWRLQAVDNNGNTGAWSQVYMFTTVTTPITYQYRPDLSITPANGATVGTDVYDVSGYTQWVMLGASTTVPATYTITVTNNGTSDDVITLISNNGVNGWKHTFVNATGTDISAEMSSITGHSITLTAGASEDIALSTLPGTTGSSYLSITGKSKNLNSSFDTVIARAFKTITTEPVFTRPILTSPANNAIISGPLSWSSPSTSTGYQIQVSTDADFRNLEFDNFVTNPNDNLGTLADDTTYYWRVRATDSDLALPASQYHWSEWSHVSLFKTAPAVTQSNLFDVNIYSKSLSSTPITMNPGDNNNQNPITQGAKIRNSASYYVVITNRGNVKSQFTISDSAVLPSDSTLKGWKMNITDMRANNITRKIFTSGSTYTTPFVDPGKKFYLRVEVAAGSNTAVGDSADANISISSTNGTVELFTTTVRE